MLYTINYISMLLEIIIIKLSSILKMMSKNTFPEPQPDSASYIYIYIRWLNHLYDHYIRVFFAADISWLSFCPLFMTISNFQFMTILLSIFVPHKSIGLQEKNLNNCFERCSVLLFHFEEVILLTVFMKRKKNIIMSIV